MKKIIIFFALILHQGVHADSIEKLWAAISEANLRTTALQNQTGAQIATLQNQIAALGVRPRQIGDEYHGGIIFYVDESGQHGLVASKFDISEEGIQWRNGTSGNRVTNARADGIGAGLTNTRLIVAGQTIDNQKGQFAALAAVNFQVLSDGITPCKTPIREGSICYSGWYLPSAFELQLLQKNLNQRSLSSFAPDYYWSSTEAGVSTAWLQNFSTGELIMSSKSETLGRVRAIHQF
ncbi:MAG: DUF1566 domain-containing protein [Silvanigrellaceae bacterium]|nr:DUF1566 domain-containing protein [Silvanigrellaceae bacterium]